ncbi:glycosyl hydrolase family 32 [Amnibacterium sp. CER49]|uniref:glycosyl hydrolase family 32 n=1 Tax=Amnibacterium sp. CER49 TaxID=3039161 RepID=UPI00244B0841|nr:glycosyl hydrolase family 32 [Amnibacterium sp. CER49]MDH2443897.1 glycosyl hydrolase family 32 [Amnibacterium sp. CER49]
MLELPDAWVWDSWLADTAEEHHLFFLFASRALRDPDLRHRRASIGHAVSTDLRRWRRLPDALVRAEPPAFDDVATWTGSVVRGDDGLWRLFYTGLSDDPVPCTQRIGVAVSADLVTWTRRPEPVVVADPRWYATGRTAGDETFRDPWVPRGPDGRWHMLVTARAPAASSTEDGVLGHAVSDDLESWTVMPPLSEPGLGFGQLEVPQVVEVDGSSLLVFSCLAPELGDRHAGSPGGIWVAPAAGPLGPFDLASARLITDASRYAGRVVRDRRGEPVLLAFENETAQGFGGRIADPVPLKALLQVPPAGLRGGDA